MSYEDGSEFSYAGLLSVITGTLVEVYLTIGIGTKLGLVGFIGY